MNLYVGNISFQATEDELKGVFGQFGEVSEVKIIKDHQTGASRGFAFVEMPKAEEAKVAIDSVKEIGGRQVVVNEARPKGERKDRFPRRENSSWR